ncbi:hypothetical protein PITC_056640 [Penicillium italicum]|uniref:Uncharacterized protein n=1 Tax=Penicillium italicum TaxID=40296 RepID=A0A0A2L0I5_PENIT|nr:hypothetical protein PITC_056640 [Penicillium italicum]
MHIDRPSIFTLVLILGVTQSTTSHPVRTSKWIKTEQFLDPDAGGIWKVFEKDGYDLMPDPPHVKYNGNPAWSTHQNDEPREQSTQNDHFTTETSELGKPTVSILLPASPELSEQMHKTYRQQTEEKQKHHSSESSKSPISALAVQRQGHYNKIPQYLQTKIALDNEYIHATTPESCSHSSLGHSPSFFAYYFSFTTSGPKVMTFPQYPLPGVFTTVIILLVMVWITIFTIGLLELGNYLWRRKGEALDIEVAQGLHSQDGDVDLDETMKVPLGIVIASSESTRSRSVGEYGYEFLESVSSDYDSGSESDDDDYRIF